MVRRVRRSAVTRGTRARGVLAVGALVLLGATLPAGAAGATGAGGSTAAHRPAARGASAQPASLVNPFAGTGTGAGTTGAIGEFPGADLPFGMLQWSPDTSPDRTDGSGYDATDHEIAGLSLTHLSGDGCPAFGDVPILPTTGSVGTDPEGDTESFSHTRESASPGRYQVALGTPAVTVSLSVTTRTGIATLAFPPTADADVLFKVSDSAGTVHDATVHTVGDDEVEGSVNDGAFCTTGTFYTLYFTAQFNRPFSKTGTWHGGAVAAGSHACAGTGCGAYVTFDTRHDRTVMLKVSISYVSAAGAAENLAAEDPGWSLGNVERAATAKWNAILGRIGIRGGTAAERGTFETALYHSLLYPSIASDVDGEYLGEDGHVHRTKHQPQYANFSEWDIYRSEIPLLCLVAPTQVGQMIQSLVNGASQTGWLPKWAMPGGDLAQMNGDSADPIIASAYAFGVRGFDVKAALGAMVKGATETEPHHGLEIERQYLLQYTTQHYVNAAALDLDSITYSAGASTTLEYALDDFSISQMAAATGHKTVAKAMATRAANWEYEFNPATGYVQGRQNGGAFPAGPVLNSSLFEPGGEQGFEEGNAVQYTWAVPQDLTGLATLMGGDAAAVHDLDALFTQLDAGRYAPYDWAGNEPSLWTPWEYDWFGDPSGTQATVRRIMTTLYGDGPVDEPGNDDLGAISSWYVWAALGLYPVTPGTATLALATPLFSSETIPLPDGHTLTLDTPHAGATEPYIARVRVSGTSVRAPVTGCPGPHGAEPAAPTHGAHPGATGATWDDPWVPAALLRSGGTLDVTVSPTPVTTWGSGAAARPPSYDDAAIPAVGATTPSGTLSVAAGSSATATLEVRELWAGGPAVRWQASTTGGLVLSATSGTLTPSPTPASGTATTCPVPAPLVATVQVSAPAGTTAPSVQTVSVTLTAATDTSLPPVVLDVDVST